MINPVTIKKVKSQVILSYIRWMIKNFLMKNLEIVETN